MRGVDKASIGGVLLGLCGIVGGLLLEGGNLSQILQPTAAMIVFGGTAGAVLIQFPLSVVVQSLRTRRVSAPGLRIGGRILADGGNHRGGAGPDSGHAAARQD